MGLFMQHHCSCSIRTTLWLDTWLSDGAAAGNLTPAKCLSARRRAYRWMDGRDETQSRLRHAPDELEAHLSQQFHIVVVQ